MKSTLLALALLATTAWGYDGKNKMLVDATITDASFETDTEDRGRWENEVRNQLHYLVSQMRGNTPSLFHSLKVDVKKVSPGRRAKHRVDYSATVGTAWWRNAGFPATVSVVMPVRADAKGLQDFANRYTMACGHDPLWYYFSAGKQGCPLTQQTPDDAQWVTVTVTPSALNTSGKMPEYEKIWEDGKLVITHVMGNTISLDGRNDDDELHRAVARAHPDAVHHVVRENFQYVTQETQFSSQSGPVVLRTMRIQTGNVQGVNAQFKADFEELQKDSDVIGYNGHAGLGQNVRAFERLIKPTKGHYFIVWINACVPFAYFDNTVFDAVKAVNDGAEGTRFADLFIVSVVGNFAQTNDVQDLMRTLPTKALSFRELTPTMQVYSPMVIGEQDNRWPNRF